MPLRPVLPARAASRGRAPRALVGLVAAGTLVAGALPAGAEGPSTLQAAVVGAVPAKALPQVLDGIVFAVAQIGDTMVVGGEFTKVRAVDGTVVAQPRVVAFDATTGALRPGFAPQLDGAVQTVVAGPRAGTVYVGGNFNTLGGVRRKGLVLLDLATGAPATGFAFPATNGTVQSVELVGSRLFVGGTFTKIGTALRGGLATLDAVTGKVDGYLTSTVTENHSWTTASPAGYAKAAVGVTRLDVTPDGSAMVAIGNFRKVDGLVHDQIAVWDLAPGAATVRDWRTLRYEPPCLEKKYDSYVRDVEISPDGDYFVTVATGGHRVGSLCDAAARWETDGSGQAVEPTWVDYTGADSLLSTAITGEAVYVGGHQRWLNNGLGRDNPGQGAVPRPGVAALDPLTGVPLAWNPGRHPRGLGAVALHATPTGLWMGSDTSYVGVGPDTTTTEAPACRPERAEKTCYARGRLAFFPLADGAPARSTAARGLPGGVHLATLPASGAPGVLARLNAGGPELRTVDAGRPWLDEDTAAATRTNGASTSAYGIPVRSVDASVPSGTPSAVFATERRDPGVKGDGKEMSFAFRGLTAGEAVQVRVYVANRCVCTTATSVPARRVFDVLVNGALAVDDLEPTLLPVQSGTVRTVPATVTAAGTVTVGFGHEVGDPVVSAIEVVRAAAPGPYPVAQATTSVRTLSDTGTVGAAAPADVPQDVATARGVVQIGSSLFYAATDGELYRRPVAGRLLGARVAVDPYSDPVWNDVSTGSGNTYRGNRPAFFNDLTNLTSLSWDERGHRLLYTVHGSTALYAQAFSPDSGALHHDREVVGGLTLPQTVEGAFVVGRQLHYADGADGTLRAVPLDGSAPARVVSGPAVGGVDWRGSVLWLGPSAGEDAPPSAAFTQTCSYASCTFNGSGSSDAEGPIRSWSWDFGDGSTGAGETLTHDYAAGGTYDVALTVTDQGGASRTTTRSVQVRSRPASAVAFVDDSLKLTASTASTLLPVPAGAAVGDTLLLTTTTNGANLLAPGEGWVQVGTWANGTATTTGLWQRTAAAGDLGTSVRVTAPANVKASAALLAYRGVGSITAAFVGETSTDSRAHATPAAPVATDGSWVVSAWTDKTATVDHAAFGLPAGLVERAQQVGSGGSYLSTVIADEGAAVPSGSAPSRTATTSIGTRGSMLTVVLAPAA